MNVMLFCCNFRWCFLCSLSTLARNSISFLSDFSCCSALFLCLVCLATSVFRRSFVHYGPFHFPGALAAWKSCRRLQDLVTALIRRLQDLMTALIRRLHDLVTALIRRLQDLMMALIRRLQNLVMVMVRETFCLTGEMPAWSSSPNYLLVPNWDGQT